LRQNVRTVVMQGLVFRTIAEAGSSFGVTTAGASL
jgi:hypothetical protein